MRLPELDSALALANQLTIPDQKSGVRIPFRPTQNQIDILMAAYEHSRCAVIKSRQIMASSICAWLTALALICNTFDCAVISYDQAAADELLAKVRDFLVQIPSVTLEIENVTKLKVEGGGTLHALSANSKTASDATSNRGRGKSWGFIWISEAARITDLFGLWASLKPGALLNCRFLAESTGSAGDADYRAWCDDPNWHRVFRGVESHPHYTADPEILSPETWDRLQKEFGFVSKSHASYWWQVHQTDIRDLPTMLREYPVSYELGHPWCAPEGQYIREWLAIDPKDITTDGYWEFVKRNAEPKILSIDVAAGVSGDSSAMTIIGHMSGQLHAVYRCNTIEIPQFTDLVAETIAKYQPTITIIEGNNHGKAVIQGLARQGIPVLEATAHPYELWPRRSNLKIKIEAKELALTPRFIAECQSSMVNKRGKFVKDDDVISAASFGIEWRDRHPYVAPVVKLDPRTHLVLDHTPQRRRR